ncbi:MAG TPA: hypothetical protein VED24_04835 [Candidatus Acidoferrum sp.]|nr:hypothetical protein [Candidatus Acidoferrum sp.]
MKMLYSELFGWWISSITFNIVFVIAASIYLYIHKKAPEKEVSTGDGRLMRIVKNFVFVWVLLGLLIFYVYTVGVGSYVIFAAGNVVVEALLALYVIKTGKTSEAPKT